MSYSNVWACWWWPPDPIRQRPQVNYTACGSSYGLNLCVPDTLLQRLEWRCLLRAVRENITVWKYSQQCRPYEYQLDNGGSKQFLLVGCVNVCAFMSMCERVWEKRNGCVWVYPFLFFACHVIDCVNVRAYVLYAGKSFVAFCLAQSIFIVLWNKLHLNQTSSYSKTFYIKYSTSNSLLHRTKFELTVVLSPSSFSITSIRTSFCSGSKLQNTQHTMTFQMNV